MSTLTRADVVMSNELASVCLRLISTWLTRTCRLFESFYGTPLGDERLHILPGASSARERVECARAHVPIAQRPGGTMLHRSNNAMDEALVPTNVISCVVRTR